MPDDPRPPNPGSDVARKLGCVCPVIDNARGLGYRGSRGPNAVFVMVVDCPLHGRGKAEMKGDFT